MYRMFEIVSDKSVKTDQRCRT